VCVCVCVCVFYANTQIQTHMYSCRFMIFWPYQLCRTSSHLCTLATAAAASLTGTKPTDSHAEADHSILAAELPGDLKQASAQKTNTSTNIYMPYMYLSFLTRILCSNILSHVPARVEIHVRYTQKATGTHSLCEDWKDPRMCRLRGFIIHEDSSHGHIKFSNSKNGWINC